MAKQRPEQQFTQINGWRVLAHKRFLDQYEQLLIEVEALQQKDSETYQKKAATKRLEAVTKLAFDIIPQDPARETYRQGLTLGNKNKHWFRAKFYQQYRLFFRYHEDSKTLVYGWFNDPRTKRAYSSKTDAYLVFQKMLENGQPPNNWNDLIHSAQAESSRLKKLTDHL